MNILVTGGAGYIGSHACKALALAGYTPVSYDNLVYGHRWAVKWGPLEEGNIADRARLNEIIAKNKAAAVMHFADYAYVGESVKDPEKYYRNNVAETLTLLRSISLRYFNAAGADPDGEIGEAQVPETHLIPLVLDASAGMRPAITIFGDDYDTSDGTCIRDNIHVSDLADAHVVALRALEFGDKTTAYNLGNGQVFPVRKVIASVEHVMRKKCL